MNTPENRILNSQQEAEQLRRGGHEWVNIPARIEADIKANYPVALAIVTAVVYNDKADRYVVKFDHGTAKATTEAATFLLQHAFTGQQKPYVYAHLTDGTVDAVLLRFIG